jgi:hypothetical protein
VRHQGRQVLLLVAGGRIIAIARRGRRVLKWRAYLRAACTGVPPALRRGRKTKRFWQAA